MARANGPVGFTCPDIDQVISSIKDGISYAGDILHALQPLEKMLEELRSSNDSLRKWGTEQEEKVAELEKEIEKLNDLLQKKR